MKESLLRRYLRFFEKFWHKFGAILLVVLALVVLGGGLVLVLILWFSMQGQGENYYLRPSLVTAGAGLLASSVGACFFAWRNWIAGKQLKNTDRQLENADKQLENTNTQLEIFQKQVGTSQEQVKTAQKQLENAQVSLQEERYKKGVELLGHESQVVRIGGLYALHQLAEDSPEKWALPVLELMCAFVRTPPRDKDKADGSGEKRLRRDVEEAVHLLGLRNSARREEEKREHEKAKKEGIGKSPGSGILDFRGADLAGGRWTGVDLGGANFRDATLTGAYFYWAKLGGANFGGGTLSRANFVGGTLTKASFEGADITGASLMNANLSGVVLRIYRAIMGKNMSGHVRGVTREQLEAGWIEEGRPPVKIIVEDKGTHGSWRWTRTPVALTEADWKELGLDSPPKLRVSNAADERWPLR